VRIAIGASAAKATSFRGKQRIPRKIIARPLRLADVPAKKKSGTTLFPTIKRNFLEGPTANA
jgi:hypothetical protein